MIEVIIMVVLHSDLLHHSTRRKIGRHSEGKNFLELQCLKPECERCTGSLSCITPIPVFRSYAPTDFDTRSETSFEARNVKTNESDKWRDIRNLHRPYTKSIPVEAGLDAFDQGVTLLARERKW